MIAGPVDPALPLNHRITLGGETERAHLVPHTIPLFDTEWLVGPRVDRDINFFTFPIYQNFSTLNEPRQKTEYDININQSMMLDYPTRFSVCGFDVILCTADQVIRAAFAECAGFLFVRGRHHLVDAPLWRFPSFFGGESKRSPTACGETKMETVPFKFNPDGSLVVDSPWDCAVDCSHHPLSGRILPFERTNRREGVVLAPGETFSAQIKFQRPLDLPKGFRCRLSVMIHGYFWRPC